MSNINESNLLLIQKCLEFYSNPKNWIDGSVDRDRGTLATQAIKIIETVNNVNKQAEMEYIASNSNTPEQEIQQFLDKIDKMRDFE